MRHQKNKLLLSLILLIITCIAALNIWAAAPSGEPVGDPKAKRGGELILHTSEFPKSFNYLVENSNDASGVFSLVYDTLIDINPTTLEFEPLIVKSWEISADKKVFTLHLDPRAKWADGKSITTDDIMFTYNSIMNPKNFTSVQRMDLSRFEPPVALDRRTIRFTAKTVHYNNFVTLAFFRAIPKHLFNGKDLNKAFNMKLPPGSGPYTLYEVKEGRYYTLKRRNNYWADQLPNRQGMYNFNLIKTKVMNQDVAFEAFKKGDYDIFDECTAKMWVTDTNSNPFRKNWIVKQKIFNYEPRSFAGMAFNMRRPLFQDIRVREAISHLFDRKYLLEKLMYGQYQPLTSYWPSLYGSGPSNPLIDYDPAKAKELLKEAGYDRLDKEGYLINQNGQRLEFTVVYSGDSFEKYMTYFAETCKQAGVKMNLQMLSWASVVKKLDDYSFDGIVFAWVATLYDNPEQLWHSKHISEPGASNVVGYKNETVDQLIDSLPPIFDASKRNEITKQIDRIIYKEYPYVLFWEANYTKILYKNIFGMPKTVFTKYGSTGDVISYWWYDPLKVKNYKAAMKANKSLPKKTVEVYYDKVAGQK